MTTSDLLADFDYPLPEDRIAQAPPPRREAARLMVIDRARPGDRPVHATVADLGGFLRAGDLIVLNDSRVRPARIRARKRTGGRVDLLLLDREGEGPQAVWRCLAPTGKGMRPGARLQVAEGFEVEVVGAGTDGRMRVRLLAADGEAEAAIRRHGVMPLPPYIRREPGDARDPIDRERYQTVFARAEGSIAAPTAGLHFSDALFADLQRRGVGRAWITLHVGPGTFLPVREERIADHRIEPEAYDLPAATATAIAACRGRAGRVVAVGTTVTRVLEACALEDGGVRAGAGWCDLYIRPGHRFRVVDVLMTNFHLPRSSLLILAAAFAGRERILAAYADAAAGGYRFYSYGDAMLIL
jgi:S-adenosylmethionine:tRNA ribosyltransferase-isomerase